ncbi:hypothetical protein Patl1_28832 [Pistacia atlantica]|uniref:Uncharacterized protein n=1 Tax=Pistacia atlantica TaxID=434234 RepID=A0ACC1BEN8_9ROSI|nr:hypothetical protein Patl1_28832 [Pistacia atlantica]
MKFSQTNASICRHDLENGKNRTRHHFCSSPRNLSPSSLYHYVLIIIDERN